MYGYRLRRTRQQLADDVRFAWERFLAWVVGPQ